MSNPSSLASADPQRPFLVIPAGGRGLRMGGGLPKQFRDWEGRTLLQATVEAFLAPGMPPLAGIALAVPESHLEEARSWPFPLWEALEALNRFDGVLLGEPSTDTLKRVDPLGRVLRTEPREEFFRAQTPQIARLGTWVMRAPAPAAMTSLRRVFNRFS